MVNLFFYLFKFEALSAAKTSVNQNLFGCTSEIVDLRKRSRDKKLKLKLKLKLKVKVKVNWAGEQHRKKRRKFKEKNVEWAGALLGFGEGPKVYWV